MTAFVAHVAHRLAVVLYAGGHLGLDALEAIVAHAPSYLTRGGWLLLEHVVQWRKWNSDRHNPLFGKVDMDRIALNQTLPEHARQAQTRLQNILGKKLPALSLEQLAAVAM